MKPSTLLALQSVGITVHILNAGLATVTHNALIALLIGAFAGGFQYFLQNAGNQSTPPPPAPPVLGAK